jgi:hypothetical protein
MHPNPCVSVAPWRTRTAVCVSLVAVVATASTQAIRGPAWPFPHATTLQLGALPVPPPAPLRGGEDEDEQARKAFIAQFAEAEAVLENAATKSAADLRKAHQTLIDLEAMDTARFGADYPERIEKMKSKIVDAVVTRLHTEAKEFAAAPGTTPRQGLARYAEAEDYVRKALLDAKQVKNPSYAAYETTFKQLVAESDEYSKRVITKDFLESVPWKDLLDADVAMKWSKTTTVPGFACRIQDGILTIDPPEAGSKIMGVCGVLDQKNDNLRHFMLDMEFEVDGVATMFFHVSPPPQNPDNRQSETFDLAGEEGSNLRRNERCRMIATYIGSDLAVWFPENDAIPRWENTPSWTKLRRGGIAFLIREGTHLRITRMRIRELR